MLCPAKKNATGTIDLSLRLRERLSPPADDKPEIYSEGAPFRLHDRVRQIRNNPRRGDDGVFIGAAARDRTGACPPAAADAVLAASQVFEAGHPDCQVRIRETQLADPLGPLREGVVRPRTEPPARRQVTG